MRLYNLNKRRPGRLQYSLRMLLILVTLFSIWLGRQVNHARRQKEIADAVRSGTDAAWPSGGSVRYQNERRSGSRTPFRDWVARTLGRDFVDTIDSVNLRPCYMPEFAPPVGHAPPMLDQLKDLRYLDVEGTDFDNAYLARLRSLHKLIELDLRDTRVTDEGLGSLVALPELATLNLKGRNIGDAGLIHLSRVRWLKNLYLTDTAVTGTGVAAFRRAVPGCQVFAVPTVAKRMRGYSRRLSNDSKSSSLAASQPDSSAERSPVACSRMRIAAI